MLKPPPVSAESTKCYFLTFLAEGVPKEELESALGMPMEKLEFISRIPGRKNLDLLKKGMALTAPGMAIKLGAAASFQITGIIGQIMKNCESVKEAVLQFIRFQNLLLGISRFSVREEGNNYVMSHTLNYPIPDADDRRMLNELNLSIVVAHGRKLLNMASSPKEVRFSHPMPRYVEIYRQHFRCPLEFNAGENAFVINRSAVERKIPDAYPSMKSVLVQYAEGLAAKLDDGIYFEDDVKRIIGDLLPKGILDIQQVSEKLNMSRWTLTRKLKKEGITFKALLGEVRKELAVTYLKNRKLSLAEIAFLLGYSEASAFQRAFKRWTGKTPQQYLQWDSRRLEQYRSRY